MLPVVPRSGAPPGGLPRLPAGLPPQAAAARSRQHRRSTPLAAREAVLVDFSFRCEVGDTCELRASPTRLWGAASERDVHVEAVLIRGMRLPGKMARAVLTVHGESSVEVEVQVHETPSGLLIPKLKAPARKVGWTLRLAAVPGSE